MRELRGGLTQHDVHLSAMVCLVIEKMADRDGRLLDVLFALVVDAGERLIKETIIGVGKESLNTGILRGAGQP